MSNFVDLSPIQIENFLSKNDFLKILQETITLVPDNIPALQFKNNIRSNLKNFDTYNLLLDKISNALTNLGFGSTTLSEFDILNQSNRKKMPWHKHWINDFYDPYKYETGVGKGSSIYNIPYEHFWIAIYYPHNLVDTNIQGTLTIKKEVDGVGKVFSCLPNSLILHNGLYGHEVYRESVDPNQQRYSCFSQWLCGDFKA